MGLNAQFVSLNFRIPSRATIENLRLSLARKINKAQILFLQFKKKKFLNAAKKLVTIFFRITNNSGKRSLSSEISQKSIDFRDLKKHY